MGTARTERHRDLDRAYERARSRRPVEPVEVPHLEALGRRLREARAATGLTQAAIGSAAELSRNHLSSLERGVRRTRASTLERLASALTEDGEAAAGLYRELVALAGPALAPESDYADRVERRRRRRSRQAVLREAWRARAEEHRQQREKNAGRAAYFQALRDTR